MPGEKEKEAAIKAFNTVILQYLGQSDSDFKLENFTQSYCTEKCMLVMALACSRALSKEITQIKETIEKTFTKENGILFNIEGLNKITSTLQETIIAQQYIILKPAITLLKHKFNRIFNGSSERLEFNEQTFLAQGSFHVIQYLMDTIEKLPKKFDQDKPSIQKRIEQLKEANIKQAKEILSEISVSLEITYYTDPLDQQITKVLNNIMEAYKTNPFKHEFYPPLGDLAFFKDFDDKKVKRSEREFIRS